VADARLEQLQRDGLCGRVAPDDARWAYGRGYGRLARERAEAVANELWKTVCSDCPVHDVCLEYAIDAEEHGIWSGTADHQRIEMRETRLVSS
jgi:hypothetical protein